MMAFTFNGEIYSSWKRGGRVWLSLDDDPDLDGSDFQQFQQTFSTFSAGAENKPEPDPAANGGNTVRSSCVHNENTLLSADLKNTETPPIASADPCVSVIRHLLKVNMKNLLKAQNFRTRIRPVPDFFQHLLKVC